MPLLNHFIEELQDLKFDLNFLNEMISNCSHAALEFISSNAATHQRHLYMV
jgi:hypothetical protein